MSQENPQTSVVQEFWNTIWKSSVFTTMGVLLALPGLLIVELLYPTATGYYIIAGISMMVYGALKLLNQENDPENDVDLSEKGVSIALVFVASVLIFAIIGTGIRLGMAAAVAIVAGTQYSQPVIAISFAVLFPVLDRKLATISPYISVSTAVVVVLVRFISIVLQSIDLFEMSKGKIVERSVLKLSN